MRRTIIGLSVLALTGALVSPAAAGARAEPSTGGCDVGTRAPLAGVTSLPDGGRIYQYRVGGEISSVPVPPAGFDPLTASARRLDTYGLPERPAGGTARTRWTAQMRVFHRPADPGLCVTPYRSRPTGAANGTATTVQAGNWAGYTARKQSSSSYYIGATGDFRQTGVHASCSGATWVGWVGIGGYYASSPALIQAGTGRLSGANHAWYEYLGRGGRGINITYMPSVHVGSGHHIHATVIYQRSTGRTTFYVYDTTNGTYQTVIKTLSAKYYYDGRSAEQIDERITRNGGLTPLYHFVSDSWTNAKAMRSSTGNWYSLGSQPHTRIVMVNGSHTLATPGGLTSSTAFKDSFKRCT